MSQGWKLDGIDFFDYGVWVSKSSGVLDMPKMVDTSHSWLDLDGKEYWQPIEDVRYEDNQILLNCFIEADSFANFKTKVAAFYAALLAVNQRTLTAPYMTATIDCYVNKGVQMKSSNYTSDQQIGRFSLALTVQNNSKFNLINISRIYSYNITAVVKTNNLKITKSLQGDSTLSMSFESNTVLDIQKDDYIQYEYEGLGQDRFLIVSEPSFTKKSTNLYVYKLQFEFNAVLLTRTQLVNSLGESDFYFYGDMSDVVDLIVSNQVRTYYNKFAKGTIVSTIKKNHHFSGENTFQVLKRIVAEYELEYEFEKDDPAWWNYIINIKEKVANSLPVTLEYGQGKGQYQLSRSERIRNDFFTKLYAFGSTKNIPAGYRGGLKRLSFDANPLSQNLNEIEYNEKTIYFDDIFPNRTANVTGYFQVLKADLTAEQEEVWTNGIYRVEDTTLGDPELGFDLNDYFNGDTPKIVMKTGALAGYEFDIVEYVHADNFIYITPFTDGLENLPKADQQIAVGDEYTLIGIDLPDSYITVAENAVQAAAVEKLAIGSSPQFTYSAKIDPKYVLDNSLFFEVGDSLTIIDTDYGINGSFRISSLTYNDFTKIYDLDFSSEFKPSRLAVIEKAVEETARTAKAVDVNDVITQKDSGITTGTLGRKLINPIDDRFNADSLVREKSFDPGMLALDAGYIQAGLKGAVLRTNVGGDEDEITVASGTFTVRNYSTLNRFEISELKAAGGTYDPTRTWNIPATNITLLTKNEYEVYLKLTTTIGSTACEIILSETHIETKQDIGFLYYNIGTISGGEL